MSRLRIDRSLTIYAERNALIGAAKDLNLPGFVIQAIQQAPFDATNPRMVQFSTPGLNRAPGTLYKELTAQLVARTLQGLDDSNYGAKR